MTVGRGYLRSRQSKLTGKWLAPLSFEQVQRSKFQHQAKQFAKMQVDALGSLSGSSVIKALWYASDMAQHGGELALPSGRFPAPA